MSKSTLLFLWFCTLIICGCGHSQSNTTDWNRLNLLRKVKSIEITTEKEGKPFAAEGSYVDIFQNSESVEEMLQSKTYRWAPLFNTSLHFNEDGSIADSLYFKYYGYKSKDTLDYNDKNRIIRSADKEFFQEVHYEDGNVSKVVKKQQEYPHYGSVFDTEFYKYDKNGQMIERKVTYPRHFAFKHLITALRNFEYDEQGNWVKADFYRHHIGYPEWFYTVKRDITYY